MSLIRKNNIGLKMSPIIRIFFIFSLATKLLCQTSATIQWDYRHEGPGDVEFYSVKTTIDGGSIVAGNNNYAGLVVKFSSDFSSVWSSIYQGANSSSNLIRSIIECADGGFVFTGATVQDNGNENLWIVKIDNDGEILWEYERILGENQIGRDVIETTEGTFIVTGHGVFSIENSWDYFAVSIDESGNEIWFQEYNEAEWQKAWALTPAEDDGYVIAGYNGNTSPNFFAIKIDSDGSVVWESEINSALWERAYAICQASDGQGYILAGKYSTTPGDALIMKLDLLGNLVWTNHIEATGDYNARSVRSTLDGGYLILGHNNAISSNYNQWLLKIDSLGNVLWEQTFPSEQNNFGWAFDALDGRTFLMAGSADQDAYYAKAQRVLPTGNIVINEIMINPNQVNDTFGEYFEVINNARDIVNLKGWQILSGFESYTIEDELFLEPSNIYVLGSSSDASLNGGITGLIEYAGITLNNFEDEIMLVDSLGNTIDSVAWNNENSFPTASGVSSALRNSNCDNSLSANWSLSELIFGDGDYGTPNGPNYYATINLDGPYYELPQIMIGATNSGVININNTGNDTLRIDHVLSSSLEFDVIILDSIIAPFTESQFNLNFSPSQIGQRTAQLSVHSNAYQNAEIEFQIVGFAIPANPDISCTPESLFFETNTGLDTLIQEVIISNEGTLDLVINDIEVSSNPTDYDFSIYSGVVPAGGEAILELSYHGPKSPIPEPNSLVFYSNDPDEASYTVQILFLETEDINADIIPNNYTVHQNYPNPFNPSTTINYGLPDRSQVSLVIYDLKGREIIRIVDQSQEAGWYNYNWMGADSYGKAVASGMYLARLEAGSFSQTIKMVYMK